ncbi:hypothetical protein BJ508DRAFT_416027 [Ascobolus immersus RN42]|uniref:Cytochrome c oxidase assembly factor 3 n=1 Tax=Ascobolus immersus RN42 TaxID=1160509 RepID=A0A3N4I4Z1_ASCIM|nr:hypothetical protein BJ508DRAFT_416027 [Ascobolus immersus RN42]
MYPSPILRIIGGKSSYYDNQYRQGAALQRARRPYLVKNVITGACILALTGAIYTYTIRAVAQDEFEDVVVPEAPKRPTTISQE